MSFPRSPATPQRLSQCLLLTFFISISFAPATALAAGTISQGFTLSDDTAPIAGTLVVLKSATANTASAANSSNADQLLGIVGGSSVLEIGSGKQVQVVVSGLTSALVSNINGTVKAGDKITSSPITGVGMKAASATEIVGTAQANLSQTSTSQETITDKQGHKQTVSVGLLPVQVNVTYFSAQSQDKLSTVVPPFLLSLGSSVAGKDVSPLRVLGGVFALMLGFITVAIMLQAAIHSGIIAIGRNPLAQGALRKGLTEVVLTALGILALTLVITYIVLSS